MNDEYVILRAGLSPPIVLRSFSSSIIDDMFVLLEDFLRQSLISLWRD